MRLKGRVIAVKLLSECQKRRMFELMGEYFYNVKEETFYSDLGEKDFAVILEDITTGIIQGFSTLKVFEHKVEKTPIRVVFSGDTIIHKKYQGERELFRKTGEFFLFLIKKYEGEKLYWFLISMGYKSYLLLPLFFKNFYPCYNKGTPEFEQKVINALGNLRYPLNYNSDAGVIQFHRAREYLKPDIGTSKSVYNNPHIKFFISRNPSHITGDELACITELSLKNFKPVLCKLIKAGG